jgi:hypothetical protein
MSGYRHWAHALRKPFLAYFPFLSYGKKFWAELIKPTAQTSLSVLHSTDVLMSCLMQIYNPSIKYPCSLSLVHDGKAHPGIADGYLRIHWISSREQPSRGSPPTWRLVSGLTSPHRKIKQNVLKSYTGDFGVAGRTILEWILEKYSGKLWTGFI